MPIATPHHIAHLVQTNFPQSEQYPSDWMQIHAGELDQLAQISIDAAKKTPGLIVWPEVPAPFSMQDPSFASRMVRIAKESGGDFSWVLSTGRKTHTAMLRINGRRITAPSFFDPAGRRIFAYYKVHLVPFGEYVPLRRWLTFAGRLPADTPDFTQGKNYKRWGASR